MQTNFSALVYLILGRLTNTTVLGGEGNVLNKISVFSQLTALITPNVYSDLISEIACESFAQLSLLFPWEFCQGLDAVSYSSIR